MADYNLVETVMSGVNVGMHIKYSPQNNYDFGEIAGVPSPTNSAVKVLALSTPGIYMWQVNPQTAGEIKVKVKMLIPSEYADASGGGFPMLSLNGANSQEKSPTKYDDWEEIELVANAPEDGSLNFEIANMSLHENSFVYVESIEIVE